MGFDEIEREVEFSATSNSRLVQFEIAADKSVELIVPPTVYPPRRDTKLMLAALGKLTCEPGHLVEIGTGSGAIAIAMAKRGWDVSAFDVNPLAVAAARGNAEQQGVSERITVEEGGVGEERWAIPREAELVIWNLPYLEPALGDESPLGPMEEAALGDEIGSNWSLSLLNSIDARQFDSRLFVLLFRIDPTSPSRPRDWIEAGWASRSLAKERIGDDTLEAVAFWRPDSGRPALFIEECESTMDAARNLSGEGWLRVRAGFQSAGRGRRDSTWASNAEDMTATWSLDASVLERHPPGLLQTAVGARIADILGMQMKWPNDLLIERRKAGGILVESSSLDGRVRIGVGLNRNPGELESEATAGWSETIGEVEASEVFAQIDSSMASLFDPSPPIPQSKSSDLCRDSWRVMAQSISRGIVCARGDNPVQIVGLQETGTLRLIESEHLLDLDEVGSVVISF